MHKAIVGLVIAGILLLGFGCGGDSDDSVSKQEYDQQIELACNKGLQKREELINQLSQEVEQREKKPSTDVQTESIRKLIGIYQETTEEIADIGLPEEGEKKAEELVQAREEAAATVEADPLGSLGVSATTFEKPNKLAEELEAKSCAT